MVEFVRVSDSDFFIDLILFVVVIGFLIFYLNVKLPREPGLAPEMSIITIITVFNVAGLCIGILSLGFLLWSSNGLTVSYYRVGMLDSPFEEHLNTYPIITNETSIPFSISNFCSVRGSTANKLLINLCTVLAVTNCIGIWLFSIDLSIPVDCFSWFDNNPNFKRLFLSIGFLALIVIGNSESEGTRYPWLHLVGVGLYALSGFLILIYDVTKKFIFVFLLFGGLHLILSLFGNRSNQGLGLISIFLEIVFMIIPIGILNITWWNSYC